MNTFFAYGLNEPEPGFCWSTHEFGLTVPGGTKLFLCFMTFSRKGHVLHCCSESGSGECFELTDGEQAIQVENTSVKPLVFHFRLEPRISNPNDIRDLGIMVQHVVEAASATAKPPEPFGLLRGRPSSFRPPAPINVPAVLAASLLRRFADQGWLRTHIVASSPTTFVLEFAFYPPAGVPAPSSLTFLINGSARVTAPVDSDPDTSRYLLKGMPEPCSRGVLDCSPFLGPNGDHIDIDLVWEWSNAYQHQSNHWRGLGRGIIPDIANITRVAGAISPNTFAFTGATWFVKLERLYRRLAGRPLGSGPILDWGCGCGRILRFFPEEVAQKVHGADIDAVNIEWCKSHYQTGTFSLVNIKPPMPYADGFFQVIYAHSVLTHLGEEDQFTWLSELARVLAPGGLAFVTALAELSWFVRFYPGRRTPEAVASYVHRGFMDDGWLDVGVDAASAGSYRTVAHTSDYIAKEWSRFFEVVEILPGFADLQTLVVLRKR